MEMLRRVLDCDAVAVCVWSLGSGAAPDTLRVPPDAACRAPSALFSLSARSRVVDFIVVT